jgi:uncharacterized OsmC-like protein
MFKASIENREDSKYYVTTRHSSFMLDTEGNGANPIDMLLASLCGCLGHYVRDYLIEHLVSHSGFTINSETKVTADKARLDKIDVRIDLKGVVLTDRQTEELLRYLENCKINKILRDNPGVAISLA